MSHDLEMMMPGSQLMLTGGASGFQSVGGIPQGARPPGPPVPPGMMPPMGPPQGPPMGGYPNPNSPYTRH